MSRLISNIFWIAVVLSAIYLIYLFAWLLGSWFTDLFEGVNDTVKATSITAIVTVTTFFIGKFWEQSRERKARINAEKIAVYRKFFDFYFGMFSHEKLNGSPKAETEVLRELLEFQKDVVFWAPDSVLKEFLKFKDELAKFANDSGEQGHADLHNRLAATLIAVAALLVAMRRDIGYTFTVFSAKDLARLQLSDDAENRMIMSILDKN